MQPLGYLALYLFVSILLVWGASLILGAFKIGDPWRTVIMVLLLLGIVVFFLRLLGLF
jgi:hypothetical protein